MIKDNKVIRITFSRSLAELIIKEVGGELHRIKLFIGDPIKDGEDSKNGLYAICKKNSNYPLRVTMFKDLAQLWRSDTVQIMNVQIKLIKNETSNCN